MHDVPVNDPTRIRGEDLERSIERQIVLTTWGRIHDLRVQVADGKVAVRGRTPSYYVKQLVLQAVFDVIGPTESIPVELDIQVGPSGRDTLPGDNDLWGVPKL